MIHILQARCQLHRWYLQQAIISEPGGGVKNLALIKLQLFGLSGLSSILAFVTVGCLTCMFPPFDFFEWGRLTCMFPAFDLCGVVWTLCLFIKPCPCNVDVVWTLLLRVLLRAASTCFSLSNHLLRVLLMAAITCSSLSLFGLLFASVTLLFTVFVVLVFFEGSFHLLFSVVVWLPLL